MDFGLNLLSAGGQSMLGGDGNYSFLIMMGAIFLVMYFFMIRPQQKKAKALQEFRLSLKAGDKVLLSSGIYGKIISISDTTSDIEISHGVTITVDRTTLNPAPVPISK